MSEKTKMSENYDCAMCKHQNNFSEASPCIGCAILYNGAPSNWESDTTPCIKDSGARREFETGGVRDICEGKGRCDLLPLDVISSLLNDAVLCDVASFMQTGETVYLFEALKKLAEKCFGGMPNMLLEAAIHMEDGSKKYGERNWEKGLPVHCYIDSGVRHYLKVLRGDADEPHLRACAWNLMCCIWTMWHKPEMNDLPGSGIVENNNG